MTRHVHTRISLFPSLSLYIYIYICIYKCIHVYTNTYNTYTYTYNYDYNHSYTATNVDTSIHTSVHYIHIPTLMTDTSNDACNIHSKHSSDTRCSSQPILLLQR